MSAALFIWWVTLRSTGQGRQGRRKSNKGCIEEQLPPRVSGAVLLDSLGDCVE